MSDYYFCTAHGKYTPTPGRIDCPYCGGKAMARPAPTEHDRPREFWLDLNAQLSAGEAQVFDEPCFEGIHVREIRRGEITLTRDELRALLEPGSTWRWRDDNMPWIEAALFPEGQLSNE